MHLYIASVLSSLFSGSNHFSTYFYVRHLLTPYSLHYYFLIVLGRLFSFPIADKLLVCTIIVCSAFGFRYLALTIGPSGDLMSLFAVPLLLSWALGMGFYNYCLSLGLAFWALGFWSRAATKHSHTLWILFLVTIALMAVTHPIPVVLVIVLCAMHVSWGILRQQRRTSTNAGKFNWQVTRFRWQMVHLLLASSTLVYIAHLASGHAVANKQHRAYDPVGAFAMIARAQYVSLFSGTRFITQMDRLSLYLLLVCAAVLAFQGYRERWKIRDSGFGDVLLTGAVLLILVIIFLPPNLHAVDAVSARLIWIVWLAVLAASSGHTRFAGSIRAAVATTACVYAIAVLALANARIRPVAEQIATIESSPVAVGSLTGIGLQLPNRPIGQELSFHPYYWAAARYFRRTESTMLNSGWTYQNYIMLGSRSSIISSGLTPEIMGTPRELENLLLRSPADQGKILPRSDLLVFVGYAKQPQEMLAEARAIDRQEPQRAWNCLNHDWYFVCTAPKSHASQ